MIATVAEFMIATVAEFMIAAVAESYLPTQYRRKNHT